MAGLIPLLFQFFKTKNAYSDGSKKFIEFNQNEINELNNAQDIESIIKIAEELSEKAQKSFYDNYSNSGYLCNECEKYICLYLDNFVRDYYSTAIVKGTSNDVANQSLSRFAEYVQNEVNKRLGVVVSCEQTSNIMGKFKSFPCYICSLTECLGMQSNIDNIGISFHGMILVIKEYIDKIIKR